MTTNSTRRSQVSVIVPPGKRRTTMNSHKKTFFIGSILVGAIFLSVSTPLPLIAQEASVSFKVCNAGKVDIDVFISRSGKVSNSRIGPADCAVVAESVGSMGPAYVGLAFADSRGQWGAVRRQDFLPLDSGFLGVMTQVQNQSVPVRHGNTTVSLPMQLLFQPPVPICRTYTGSAELDLPLNATPADRAFARRLDSMGPKDTVCDQLGYVLNVLAYPDSREITFKKFCDSCDKKAAARITPEERAAGQRRSDAANQVMGGMAASSPLGEFLMGNLEKQVKKQEQEEQRERQKELAQPQRVNWNDMGEFLFLALPQHSTQPPVNKKIIVQGTVSRVDLPRPGSSQHWVNVYFKEIPDKAFDMCTSRPEILQDLFGPDFSSRMIGKTVEVEGEVTEHNCESTAGIWVTLSHQLHVVGPGQVPTAAPVWVRPSPSAPPIPSNEAEWRLKYPKYMEEQQKKWNAPLSSVGKYDPQWMGKEMHLSGTVSRVKVEPGRPPWLTVYFTESPDSTFVVCSPSVGSFQAMFGKDYSGLIGKTLEVAGYIAPTHPPTCDGKTANIRVSTSSEDIKVH